MNYEECPICLTDDINTFKITTPCKHVFCLECFIKLKQYTCPTCRNDFQNILPKNIKDIINKNSSHSDGISINNIAVDVDNLIEFPFLSS
jgi:Holliday junction resolvase RusA-like endonuclease